MLNGIGRAGVLPRRQARLPIGWGGYCRTRQAREGGEEVVNRTLPSVLADLGPGTLFSASEFPAMRLWVRPPESRKLRCHDQVAQGSLERDPAVGLVSAGDGPPAKQGGEA